MMDNGDIPASPTKHDSEHFQNPIRYTTGLTKREHFAGLALAAMMSNSNLNEGMGFSGEEMMSLAIQAADSLLKALEEE